MLSKAAQAAIIEADTRRRSERLAREDAMLGIDSNDNQQSDRYKIAHAPKDSHVNACLVRSIGVVCPPPKTSASQNCWNRGMKGTTRGVAPGSKDPTPSMLVTYADGSSVVVPVTSTRATSKRERQTSTVNNGRRAMPISTGTIHQKYEHNYND